MFRRTVFITGLVLTLACGSLMAQGQKRKAAGNAAGKQRIEKLQQKLNLSESQMGAFRSLEENRRKETRALRQELRQQGQDKTQGREKAREIKQRFMSGVRDLLTPEQRQNLPKKFR